MLNDEALHQFWQSYLLTLPAQHVHRLCLLPDAWGFGDSPGMADESGELVVKGIKTATCSRYLGKNVLADAGLSIILAGDEQPLCLIETYEITVRRYCDVDAEFATAEGEGDLSLEYWRKVHWRFFSREAMTEGYEVSNDMLLSCERFRVLYRNSER